MADMYTTLNACRSYLYTTAKAVDRNIVSNKVFQKLFVAIKYLVLFRIVLVLFYIVLKKPLNFALMVYRFLVVMDILMIIQLVGFYAMRNYTKLVPVQVKFDELLSAVPLMQNMALKLRINRIPRRTNEYDIRFEHVTFLLFINK
jgi:hypothetical protein